MEYNSWYLTFEVATGRELTKLLCYGAFFDRLLVLPTDKSLLGIGLCIRTRFRIRQTLKT